MPADDVAWAVADLTSRGPTLARRRAYYDGHHDPVVPDSRTLSPMMRQLLDDLTDNLCDDVVDERLDRLEVRSWSDAQVDQAWEVVRGSAWLREVFRESWALGDGYVIVQRNHRQEPVHLVQRAEQMAVRYDPDDPSRIQVAAKAWLTSGRRWRLNLYYPPTGPDDRIDRPNGVADTEPWVERYTTKGTAPGNTMPQAKSFGLITAADSSQAPIEALEGDRIPVFHYPADAWGTYGRSAITPCIPPQNVLNKSVADLVVAGEFTALPQRWATGVQVEVDPETGQERSPFRSGAERILRTGNTEARFGEFASGDLGNFLAVQTAYRLEIARKGRLPLWSVALDSSGNNAPSGLALLVAETRLVKVVQRAQDWGGLVLREQMTYDQLLRSNRALDVNTLEVQWAPAATRDEQGQVETLTAKVDGLGLPKSEALIEAGYDPDKVRGWEAEADAQAVAISGGRTSMPGLQPGQVVPVPPAGPAGAPQPAGA